MVRGTCYSQRRYSFSPPPRYSSSPSGNSSPGYSPTSANYSSPSGKSSPAYSLTHPNYVSPSPGYSPTFLGYSPTSPCYSPISPCCSPVSDFSRSRSPPGGSFSWSRSPGDSSSRSRYCQSRSRSRSFSQSRTRSTVSRSRSEGGSVSRSQGGSVSRSISRSISWSRSPEGSFSPSTSRSVSPSRSRSVSLSRRRSRSSDTPSRRRSRSSDTPSRSPRRRKSCSLVRSRSRGASQNVSRSRSPPLPRREVVSRSRSRSVSRSRWSRRSSDTPPSRSPQRRTERTRSRGVSQDVSRSRSSRRWRSPRYLGPGVSPSLPRRKGFWSRSRSVSRSRWSRRSSDTPPSRSPRRRSSDTPPARTVTTRSRGVSQDVSGSRSPHHSARERDRDGLMLRREESPGFQCNVTNSKRSRISCGKDRISLLPNEILVHILSFLTMDEAVASGILSKRWEYLWTQIPNLVYDNSNKKVDYPCPYVSRVFLKFIERTLNLHSCTQIKAFMVKFLYYSFYSRMYYDHFDTWFSFALKNKVKELSLIMDLTDYGDGNRAMFVLFAKSISREDLYTLPRKLCVNSYLTKLELTLCKFTPHSSILWNSLRSLSLRCVVLDENILEQIEMGSPKLEFLELDNFTGLRRINIKCPTIKRLVLRDFHHNDSDSDSISDDEEDHQGTLKVSCPNVTVLEMSGSFGNELCQLQVTDTRFLVEANLDFISSCTCENCHKMVKDLLGRLGNVEKLSVGSWFLKVLSTMVENNLISPLSRCKSLTLNLSSKIERDDLYKIVCILESLPNLEALTLVMTSSFKKPERSSYLKRNEFPKLKRSLNCLQQHLRTVEVINLVEKEHESEFLQYLLANAKKLEKMTIQVSKEVEMSESYKLAKTLLNFPRASAIATISFSEGH